MTTANSDTHITLLNQQSSNQPSQSNIQQEKWPWWKKMVDLISQPQSALETYEQAVSRQRLAAEYEGHIQRLSGCNAGVRRNPIKESPYTRIELP